jgi:hypothetical protein
VVISRSCASSVFAIDFPPALGSVAFIMRYPASGGEMRELRGCKISG